MGHGKIPVVTLDIYRSAASFRLPEKELLEFNFVLFFFAETELFPETRPSQDTRICLIWAH